ncbi:SdiA-regulated domain-containing protein [Aridibaculum aurantiacum]|uniref:SdiA-regulated domain-containing protein n=1 Tax=Aridibaculum aurantiacum TaxID=2810307 RepID=UPI001A97C30B|nr:SdiA-regulated domain-containing protein [Aridibaculum aurantiacum]
MCRFLKIANLLLLTGWTLLSSCNMLSGKQKYPDIAGYDIHTPVVVSLKTELDEISGVVYYPKDTSVFAVNDELGLLYKIYIRNKVRIESWQFSKDADYEDLALVDSTFYALHSNGNLTRFRIYASDSLDVEELKLPVEGKNEFETLYYDSAANKLVVICKDCKSDKKEVTAYAYDLDTKSFSASPYFTISGKQVLAALNSEEKKFKPSAAAIHPITQDLYIVSSVNKCLVIAERDGKIKDVIPLDPARFKQPEGLNFTPAGDMLISNEAAEVGAGNILIFKSKPSIP